MGELKIKVSVKKSDSSRWILFQIPEDKISSLLDEMRVYGLPPLPIYTSRSREALWPRIQTQFAWPRDCFFKVPQSFCRRKAITKSQILWLQIWFTHIFLKWTEVTFIQEVSVVYTVFRSRLTRKWKVSGAPSAQTWTAQSRVQYTNQQEGMVISEQLLVWDMILILQVSNTSWSP